MSKGGALDVQVGGGHYKDFGIQPVEFFFANKVEFLEGNIIKYAMRHAKKNKAEDLKKSRHYCDLTIQLHYPEEWEKMQAEEKAKFDAAVDAEVSKRLAVLETLDEIEKDLAETPEIEFELHDVSIGDKPLNGEFEVKKYVSSEPFIHDTAPAGHAEEYPEPYMDDREVAPRCAEDTPKEHYTPGSTNYKAKKSKA